MQFDEDPRSLFERFKEEKMSLIDKLVIERVHESEILEFKQQEIAEEKLARAISGFANTHGGLIVWGIVCDTVDDHDCVQGTKPISRPHHLQGKIDGLLPQLTSPAVALKYYIILEEQDAGTTNGNRGYLVTFIPKVKRAKFPVRCIKNKECYQRIGKSFEAIPWPDLQRPDDVFLPDKDHPLHEGKNYQVPEVILNMVAYIKKNAPPLTRSAIVTVSHVATAAITVMGKLAGYITKNVQPRTRYGIACVSIIVVAAIVICNGWKPLQSGTSDETPVATTPTTQQSNNPISDPITQPVGPSDSKPVESPDNAPPKVDQSDSEPYKPPALPEDGKLTGAELKLCRQYREEMVAAQARMKQINHDWKLLYDKRWALAAEDQAGWNAWTAQCASYAWKFDCSKEIYVKALNKTNELFHRYRQPTLLPEIPIPIQAEGGHKMPPGRTDVIYYDPN